MTYAPPRGFVTALDLWGATSTPRGFAVALRLPQVSGPVAHPDAYAIVTDTTLTVDAPGVLGNDVAPPGRTLSAHLDTPPAHGAVTLQTDGGFVYVPDVGYTGTDAWAYHARTDIDANSSPTTVTITIGYPPVTQYTRTAATLPWASERRVLRAVTAGFAHGARRVTHAALRWTAAPVRQADTDLQWQRSAQARQQAALPWQQAGAPLTHTTTVPVGIVPARRIGAGLPWGVPPVRLQAARVPWRHPSVHEIGATLPWGVPAVRQIANGVPWRAPPRREHRARLPWGKGQRVAWHTQPPVVEPPPTWPLPQYTPGRGFAVPINLACPRPRVRGFAVPIPMGPAACYFAWPRPRTYVMHNSASVKATVTGHAISVDEIDISESLDNAMHSFRLRLADPADLDWLTPQNGDPIAVEIRINGWLYTGIVESWERADEFPGAKAGVSGRALCARLDAPYAPPRSYISDQDRLAQQLMARELEFTGCALAYDTVDWLIPAGVWSYTGQSPLQAIRTLAAAAGAVARSHPWDDVIEVLPAWPSSPWDWPTTTPDAVIVDDYVPRLTDRNATSGNRVYQIDLPLWPGSATDKPGLVRPGTLLQFSAPATWKGLVTATHITARVQQAGNGATALVVWQALTVEAPPVPVRANYVLVSGTQAGVSAPVIRQGTAGDTPLPQIVDPLIVTDAVQRERGRNALAGGGDGLASSNMWLALRELTGQARTLKGNVIAINGDDSLTIATADGATIRARPLPGQTWQVTAGVMVQGGYVIDTAPNLPGTTQYV